MKREESVLLRGDRRKEKNAAAEEFTRLAEERAQRQAEPLSNGVRADVVSDSTQMGRATKEAFAEGGSRKVMI